MSNYDDLFSAQESNSQEETTLSPLDSGIGINRLRDLIDAGEIEYVRNGNKCLLVDQAIWDWYERNKVKLDK